MGRIRMERIDLWAKTYMITHKVKESTARRIASERVRIFEKMKTQTINLFYGPKGKEKTRIRATLMHHIYLHDQPPGGAFLRVYDVQNQVICLIPSDYTIEEVN